MERSKMINSLSNLALFSLSFIIGIAMLVEGFLIVKLHRRIIPLPTKVLIWVSIGLVGKEKAAQRFGGKTTPEALRTYALFVLLFGTSLVVSSLVYLNWILAQ
jgi:hypothetical protein